MKHKTKVLGKIIIYYMYSYYLLRLFKFNCTFLTSFNSKLLKRLMNVHGVKHKLHTIYKTTSFSGESYLLI